jgi:hypothetical protein
MTDAILPVANSSAKNAAAVRFVILRLVEEPAADHVDEFGHRVGDVVGRTRNVLVGNRGVGFDRHGHAPAASAAGRGAGEIVGPSVRFAPEGTIV